MNRRAFLSALSGGLLAAPLAAEAQPAGRMYRIEVLGNENVRLRQWLRDLGYL
jgi:hypothetical protein